MMFDQRIQILSGDDNLRKMAVEDMAKRFNAFAGKHAGRRRIEPHLPRRIDGHSYFLPGVPIDRHAKNPVPCAVILSKKIEKRVCRAILDAAEAAENRS